MKQFLDENFLLSTETAKKLYSEYAAKTPVLDYHCHINPKEIFEDKRFENIAQIWLGGDHYKWRLMRANAVDENYITGKAPDVEKFVKWAQTLEKAIGNPIYHWSHLELQRYFGFYGHLNGDNALEVWDLCNAKLKESDMTVRGIIKKSNVRLICTTDDPIDTLEWHKKIKEDKSFDIKVLPAWRPDKAMNIEKPDFLNYIKLLSEVSGISINSFQTLKEAIKIRLEFFNSMGAKASDHGLNFVSYCPANDKDIEIIFKNKFNGKEPSKEEELKFKTAFMIFCAKEYNRLGWVMQLHYACKRNNNTAAFNKLGPDTGYDCINDYAPIAELADFLNALETTDELPKTIVYSLNPNDDDLINAVLGCFQGNKVPSKLQHGSAWWFNDHKSGMLKQMKALANNGLLSNFVGMLTDSRSFVSYPRHEYFRRLLCDLLGAWVENGEYPNDMNRVGKIVQDISYFNAIRFFGFDLK
jgi:glucuronate isomerase